MVKLLFVYVLTQEDGEPFHKLILRFSKKINLSRQLSDIMDSDERVNIHYFISLGNFEKNYRLSVFRGAA
jgi:hypothetical protein